MFSLFNLCVKNGVKQYDIFNAFVVPIDENQMQGNKENSTKFFLHFPGEEYLAKNDKGYSKCFGCKSAMQVLRDELKNMLEDSEKNPCYMRQARRYFNYPYEAIAEALTIVVCCKDYEVDMPVEVKILPDRIEIWSHLGVGQFIDVGGSEIQYLNRRIYEFMKELRLIEDENTRFQRIKRAFRCNCSQKILGDMDEKCSDFRVTIYSHPECRIGKWC